MKYGYPPDVLDDMKEAEQACPKCGHVAPQHFGHCDLATPTNTPPRPSLQEQAERDCQRAIGNAKVWDGFLDKLFR